MRTTTITSSLRRRVAATVGVLAIAFATAGIASPAAAGPSQDKPEPGSQAASSASPDAAAAREAPRGRERAEAARADVQANVRRWVQNNGAKHDFATYVDATGRVVLKTNAPADVRAEVVGRHRDEVQVIETSISDLWNRRDDVPSFWGGAGITNGGSICSAGYTVKNGAGTRFMVTAGHCFLNGQTAYTESGARVFGTVSGRMLPSKDMELIGGQSYWGYIYTGGVTSTSGMPVVGAGDSVVGYGNYCHSGRTTGENCGHTSIDNFAQVCTASGCKYPVTAFQGGYLPQPGDSGSPFYVKDSSSAWIRGHVIAGDGTTSYAEKFSRVASQYGVSIVTA